VEDKEHETPHEEHPHETHAPYSIIHLVDLTPDFEWRVSLVKSKNMSQQDMRVKEIELCARDLSTMYTRYLIEEYTHMQLQ